ncbi:MAG: short-chain dehydrogenase, partial [Acidobacteria bacterium]
MTERVVFITGANGGLGTFVTKRFLEIDAIVVGGSRKISKEDFEWPNFVPLPVDF